MTCQTCQIFYLSPIISLFSYVGFKVLNWETEKPLPGATKLVRPVLDPRLLDLPESLYETEDPFEMPDERYELIARLRQEGLDACSKSR